METEEGFPHKAIIDYASNEVDVETGTKEVRASVDNSRRFVQPRAIECRVRVPVGKPYEAVLVPESAINTDQDRKFLLIVDAKNEVKRCDVQLGRLLDNGMQVVASSHAAAGERYESHRRRDAAGTIELCRSTPILEPGPTDTASR